MEDQMKELLSKQREFEDSSLEDEDEEKYILEKVFNIKSIDDIGKISKTSG